MLATLLGYLTTASDSRRPDTEHEGKKAMQELVRKYAVPFQSWHGRHVKWQDAGDWSSRSGCVTHTTGKCDGAGTLGRSLRISAARTMATGSATRSGATARCIVGYASSEDQRPGLTAGRVGNQPMSGRTTTLTRMSDAIELVGRIRTASTLTTTIRCADRAIVVATREG